ncbi:hypothetical protein NEHOM01_1767 [Nematocida homosporus]|uniref:uncharacterized protein n=1 Tax=Nematocida homosporus TaxID=1912981 RepID=UPI00221F51A2|nr:uncharacterized protein NEHOM01_1767 [Nematocida homosporus]KAI5186878.1 hypothetical protein NEHOM01_1767 [Nematocida homosporus]
MKIGHLILHCFGSGIIRHLSLTSTQPHAINNHHSAPLVLKFSSSVFPILPASQTSQLVLLHPGESLQYRKRITRAEHLDSESGLLVCTAGTITDSTIKITRIYDRPIVPDYTTPYLVFGLCGGVIISILSAGSKTLLGLI